MITKTIYDLKSAKCPACGSNGHEIDGIRIDKMNANKKCPRCNGELHVRIDDLVNCWECGWGKRIKNSYSEAIEYRNDT